MVKDLGLALLVLLALVVFVWGVNVLFRWALQRVSARTDRWRYIRQYVRRQYARRLRVALVALLRLARALIILAALVVFVPIELRLLPWTHDIAPVVQEYLLAPLRAFGHGFIKHLPNLLAMLVIFFLAWVLLRIARAVFAEIGRGAIRISGFDQNWAPFTYKITAVLIWICALLVAFPYVPGSETMAFRGVTIFLGALFSLSSTAIISNVLAGIILTYTSAFRIGEVIKIGETLGIATARRLLTTRLRTFKNEEVSIPNAVILNSHVTNYSTMARAEGVILHTTITIGYNAPWQKVHELLIAAARATPFVLERPAPFVLQTSLNDFHISYQINIYTDKPRELLNIYSALHHNIQDQFNTAGVEIMSPGYTSLRDGNEITIPPQHRAAEYHAPPFRIVSEPPKS
ncbi:MAG TPA: mechanosensitive ion channel domain-containing protein [Blastocatellia bacterium]|nr:mechanosensitive ion channel domain-containing protein [Blastocatellia bacterium]